ncbi:MAG TPA: hypothetical protein VIZ00_11610, partial [Streptosporangiaceae bacterium]
GRTTFYERARRKLRLTDSAEIPPSDPSDPRDPTDPNDPSDPIDQRSEVILGRTGDPTERN